MDHAKRLARVLGSWITGYGGGLGTIVTLGSTTEVHLNLIHLFTVPAIAGLIVALPQLGKVVNEFGTMETETD